ncbi:uncharacterized protein LOC132551825 [Ylistrum balloti]|uniref:uncharacterized protein LOC132551825 n=1 Tax=Ylistrum balloti TaxID=509963 RepID=UPI002905AA42|nr:uncharacterized protein LOC132551825 [Ylistrum balloti]
MPFGLSNAPAVFSELMSIVLRGLDHMAIAYLDDILIFSPTIEEHLEHIRIVFNRLRQHDLRLKLKKCFFAQTETKYLGFTINKGGVMPDMQKVEAIRAMAAPTNVREVRGFIGCTSYYRRFIPNFSYIAEPLIALTRKYAKFKWTQECEKAFIYLKDSLTAIPYLAYPDINQPYILYTDASDRCIGACLTQSAIGEKAFLPNIKNERPIYFLSHKLSDTQTRWSTIEKEAYAIHYALQKLDHYLHNAEFVIRTDHKPLKYILDSPMQNRKIQLWALSLSGYNCRVEYIPGTENTCADLLSRSPGQTTTEDDTNPNDDCPDITDKTFEIAVLNSNQFDPKDFASCEIAGDADIDIQSPTLLDLDMRQEQPKDETIADLIQKLTEADDSKAIHRKYMLVEGVLYYITDPDNKTTLRLYVPEHLRGKETDIPPFPFAKVGLDLSGPYPRSLSGNKYIVSFVDWYSGWPEAFAVPDKSAETIAHLLIEEIFPRYGAPLQIVTDNGTENENRVMRETLAVLNISHLTTAFYHPQSNAKVERFHRTLHDILAKKLDDDTTAWDVYLNQTLAAVRFNISESSKFSPFFLLYNRDVVLPVDNLLQPRRKYVGEELHQIALEQQHKSFMLVHKNLKRAKQRQERYANRHTKPVEFKVGDPVHYRNHLRKNKLDNKWALYYRIISQTTPVSFVIRNQLDGTVTKAHAEHLRLAKIDEWEIPHKPTGRPPRRAKFVVPPTDSADADSESSDSDIPLADIARRFRRERSSSSGEDNIPLMELTKRWKRAQISNSPPDRSSHSASDSNGSTVNPVEAPSSNSASDNVDSDHESMSVNQVSRFLNSQDKTKKGERKVAIAESLLDVLSKLI